jgi:putative membrane protein
MHTMIVRPGFAFCVVALMQTLGFAPAARAEAVSAETFVQKVANSDLFEIQSGQLVAQKAEDSDTKSFGARMVTDHQKTTQELKGLVEGNQSAAPGGGGSRPQSKPR